MNRDQDRIRGLQEFCQRWLEKADEYELADLAGSFDAFFSVFVAYNALYTEVATQLMSSGMVKRSNQWEHIKATVHVPLYLGPTQMANEIREDPKCRESVREIVQLIKNGTFYIHITKGSPDRESDRKCVEGIEKGRTKSTASRS